MVQVPSGHFALNLEMGALAGIMLSHASQSFRAAPGAGSAINAAVYGHARRTRPRRLQRRRCAFPSFGAAASA